MAYALFIGDYSYSSWSLRGWLLFRRFGIDADIHNVDFQDKDVAQQMARHAPARTVPTLVMDDAVVWDSLAIAEELASRHPEAGLWPADPGLRALARSLAAEMHSGFGALRNECPMNLRTAYADFTPSDATKADIARIEELWAHAQKRSDGPWLCGDYSAADAFYAPVAARIAGYGIAVSAPAQAYVDQHLNDPAFRRWRAMGFAKGATLPWYARDHAQKPWPGPAPIPAEATDTGTPENQTCPYSGDPVTHLMRMQGRTFGFCNAFCRDKTVADPEAWPAFMQLLEA
ncbi:glutathione S-transferase [Tropicibacter oceani]|uniref:Glutathione S-transferase n=1 Tax=Tropicibacter oceani TaxID=3058420 RepID=A0ABY8QL85_9RHOB|nr:glutathione S-transferase [Tropicibacter oceani]WGW05377.1 glutathione S-transferase [Tropicibacter oceani]